MALIGHPIVNDRRYTYGHAAQVGLCQGRRQAKRTGSDSCEDDDSLCDVTPDAEQCAAEDSVAGRAEVRARDALFVRTIHFNALVGCLSSAASQCLWFHGQLGASVASCTHIGMDMVNVLQLPDDVNILTCAWTICMVPQGHQGTSNT